jgi:hypothetical protein
LLYRLGAVARQKLTRKRRVDDRRPLPKTRRAIDNLNADWLVRFSRQTHAQTGLDDDRVGRSRLAKPGSQQV